MSGNGHPETDATATNAPRTVEGTLAAVSQDGRECKIGPNWYNVSQLGAEIEEGLAVGDQVTAVVDNKQGKFLKSLQKKTNGNQSQKGVKAPEGSASTLAPKQERKPTSTAPPPPPPAPKPNRPGPTPFSTPERPQPAVGDDRIQLARTKNDFIVHQAAITAAVHLLGHRVALGQVAKGADLASLVLADAKRFAAYVKTSADGNGNGNGGGKPKGSHPKSAKSDKGSAAAAPAAASNAAAASPNSNETPSKPASQGPAMLASQGPASNQTLKRLIEIGTTKHRSQKDLNADAFKRYGKKIVAQLTETAAQDYIKFLSQQVPPAAAKKSE